MRYCVPQSVIQICEQLTAARFEAYIVGGCVRDILLHREPKDWDITTNALPEQIQALFPDHVYENTFGTVGIKVPRFHPNTPLNYEHDIIEVTTYRTETGYSDNRRPDHITFVTSLTEDLARRDFTINAIAASIDTPADTQGLVSLTLTDPFFGQTDLDKKVLRAVGDPSLRFNEDALRMMRAIRLVTELRDPQEKDSEHSWHIEPDTLSALTKHAANLHHISSERIRDELSRIILSKSPAYGISLLHTTGLLKYSIPELEEGVGVGQNLHHIYTVWEHNLKALETCPSEKLHVRLAALLHDVGKPRTKRGNGLHSTFYNHDHVGARMTKVILTRLKYPRDIVDLATLLVDNHLFYYNVGEVTEASVRRLIKRVGLENMPDLMAVRIGDRLGSGVPKAKPYKLRHLEYLIDKVSHDPISVKMLKVNGQDLMQALRLAPGPKIGAILDVLLAETIEDPSINIKETLIARAASLMEHDLDNLRVLAKTHIEERRDADDTKIKQQHFVQ